MEKELLKKIKALYEKSLLLETSNEVEKKEILADIKYMALLISRGMH